MSKLQRGIHLFLWSADSMCFDLHGLSMFNHTCVDFISSLALMQFHTPIDALSFSLEVQRQFLEANWEPDLLAHHVCNPQWTSLRAAFLKNQQRLWEGSFGVVDTEALDRTIVEAMQMEQLEGNMDQQPCRPSGVVAEVDGQAHSALKLYKRQVSGEAYSGSGNVGALSTADAGDNIMGGSGSGRGGAAGARGGGSGSSPFFTSSLLPSLFPRPSGDARGAAGAGISLLTSLSGLKMWGSKDIPALEGSSSRSMSSHVSR